MALARSNPVATLAVANNLQSHSMSAFTPTANSLLLLYAASDSGESNIANVSLTGGGLTWTNLLFFDSGLAVCSLWYALVGGSPASTTITYDNGATWGQDIGCIMVCEQWTGHDTGSPIVQSKSGTGTAANPSLTLNSNMNTNNGYSLGVFVPRNAAAVTEPTGWTEAVDTGHANPTSGFEQCYRINGETGGTVQVTSSSSVYGMLFAEIKASSRATTSSDFCIGGNLFVNDVLGVGGSVRFGL